MMPRVCLAGEFRFGGLAASWARAFQLLGISIVKFDIQTEFRARLHWLARNRVSHRLTIRSYPVRQWAARKYNQALADRVLSTDAQILVLHNAQFVFPETLRRLRSHGVKVVIFNADNPFPPHSSNWPETLPAARETDLFLTWSERLLGILTNAGVQEARFLPFAWDPEVFPYAAPPADPWEGVLFVGGWDREREAFLDRIAERFPLRVYGPVYWERTRRRSAARKCWMGRALTGGEAASEIRNCAISLNILRNQHYVDGHADGLIMRHFEVPGAGGFLLSTRSGGATRLFPEGESADYFDDAEECLKKIDRYLKNSAMRDALVAQAHAEVEAKHQYVHRIQEMFEYLSQCRR